MGLMNSSLSFFQFHQFNDEDDDDEIKKYIYKRRNRKEKRFMALKVCVVSKKKVEIRKIFFERKKREREREREKLIFLAKFHSRDYCYYS